MTSEIFDMPTSAAYLFLFYACLLGHSSTPLKLFALVAFKDFIIKMILLALFFLLYQHITLIL